MFFARFLYSWMIWVQDTDHCPLLQHLCLITATGGTNRRKNCRKSLFLLSFYNVMFGFQKAPSWGAAAAHVRRVRQRIRAEPPAAGARAERAPEHEALLPPLPPAHRQKNFRSQVRKTHCVRGVFHAAPERSCYAVSLWILLCNLQLFFAIFWARLGVPSECGFGSFCLFDRHCHDKINRYICTYNVHTWVLNIRPRSHRSRQFSCTRSGWDSIGIVGGQTLWFCTDHQCCEAEYIFFRSCSRNHKYELWPRFRLRIVL